MSYEKDFENLNFVFCESGFALDRPDGNDDKSVWRKRFREDKYSALYELGFEKRPESATATLGYLHSVSSAFISCLTSKPEIELAREKLEIEPDKETVEELVESVPYALGAEHVNSGWIKKIFKELKKVYAGEIKDFDGTAAMYLAEKNQTLRVPERVYFHLVEQKDEEYPFAFLATYATKGEGKKIKHQPLGYALTEYRSHRTRLMTLLSCLNKAAEVSPIISSFVTSGELFHPLRLTASEAYSFLKDVEAIEETGILCRIPNWWRKKSMHASLSIKMGDEKPSYVGFESLIRTRPQIAVDGVPLSKDDIELLLAQSEGLALIKGKWVEVNHEKLRAILAEMESCPDSMTLMDVIQTQMGIKRASANVGATITNGKWLSDFLASLRRPEKLKKEKIPRSLHATLRPYQEVGYRWLAYMDEVGLGACLADDMGLGKTVQVLAYLERKREKDPTAKNLLVVPASLLGNWQKEIERFAPEMSYLILHGSGSKASEDLSEEGLPFLTITTYGMVAKTEALSKIGWHCVILDEAQAIKNPLTNQTRAVKKLRAEHHLVMTGTPIENDLSNLWSIFDFLNKGLLGSSKQFGEFCKTLSSDPQGYARLKEMVSPFILRRLKTDKKIISDLPDKVETKDYVSLTGRQIALYNQVTDDLERQMSSDEDFDGMKKRGLVLATITKLKQICNHPDEYLGQSAFEESESGKLQLLREICETISEKRERVIVFTQFREIIDPLSDFLRGVFKRPGLVLHGGISPSKRTQIVDEFQNEDEYIPYLVISLKAGGVGLNLTNANHVIHFDRWWNPAVENQATDRAYRIGQNKKVMVHKFVVKDTIEEKIDELINSKVELSENVIGESGEQWITELGNDEILSMLKIKE